MTEKSKIEYARKLLESPSDVSGDFSTVFVDSERFGSYRVSFQKNRVEGVVLGWKLLRLID